MKTNDPFIQPDAWNLPTPNGIQERALSDPHPRCRFRGGVKPIQVEVSCRLSLTGWCRFHLPYE